MSHYFLSGQVVYVQKKNENCSQQTQKNVKQLDIQLVAQWKKSVKEYYFAKHINSSEIQ